MSGHGASWYVPVCGIEHHEQKRRKGGYSFEVCRAWARLHAHEASKGCHVDASPLASRLLRHTAIRRTTRAVLVFGIPGVIRGRADRIMRPKFAAAGRPPIPASRRIRAGVDACVGRLFDRARRT